MIGIFQGSPEGRANECQRRTKGGLPRATSKNQGKRRAWQGALPKAGQFGSYGGHLRTNILGLGRHSKRGANQVKNKEQKKYT